MFNLSSILNIVNLGLAGFKTAESYVTAAPALIAHIPDGVAAVKKGVTDIEKLISDAKSGKYGNMEGDGQTILSDFSAIITAGTGVAGAVISIAGQASTLPSTNGISAVKKAVESAPKK